MITAQKRADGSFELINGYHRLKAILRLHGKAEVVDLGTGETIHVHEVGGQLLALSDESQANVEDLASSVINRARHASKDAT